MRKARMFKESAQQGDVTFERVKSVPKGAKRVQPSNGRYILAKGETGGHAHTIEAEGIECYELDGKMYLKVLEEPSPVIHEEHGSGAGDRKIVIVDRQEGAAENLAGKNCPLVAIFNSLDFLE